MGNENDLYRTSRMYSYFTDGDKIMGEIIAFIGVACVIFGGWMVSPGVGIMTVGIVLLFASAYFGVK